MTETTNGLLVTDGDRRWFIPETVLAAHEVPGSATVPGDDAEVEGFALSGPLSAKLVSFDGLKDLESEDRLGNHEIQRFGNHEIQRLGNHEIQR
jgi:hypothetical protein